MVHRKILGMLFLVGMSCLFLIPESVQAQSRTITIGVNQLYGTMCAEWSGGSRCTSRTPTSDNPNYISFTVPNNTYVTFRATPAVSLFFDFIRFNGWYDYYNREFSFHVQQDITANAYFVYCYDDRPEYSGCGNNPYKYKCAPDTHYTYECQSNGVYVSLGYCNQNLCPQCACTVTWGLQVNPSGTGVITVDDSRTPGIDAQTSSYGSVTVPFYWGGTATRGYTTLLATANNHYWFSQFTGGGWCGLDSCVYPSSPVNARSYSLTMGAFASGTLITNFVPIPSCDARGSYVACTSNGDCAAGERCDLSSGPYCVKCNGALQGACGIGQGLCEAACGADAACDEKSQGASCGTGGICDNSCRCVVATEICTDRVDNDGDGAMDCADPDCAGKTGPNGFVCCQNINNCPEQIQYGRKVECKYNECRFGFCRFASDCAPNFCCEGEIGDYRTSQWGCVPLSTITSDRKYLCARLS